MNDLYIALIHHPVHNKEGKIITTSVTNFDLHDLARTGTTYGVKKFFVVTPSEVQQNMVNYIKNYWTAGFGADYNPSRKEAITFLETSPSLEDTCLTIKNHSGSQPLLVATTAKKTEKSVSYSFLRQKKQDGPPLLLMFGTGFGLASEVLDKADYILDPITGVNGYNHLPVRSAVAIILDRLIAK